MTTTTADNSWNNSGQCRETETNAVRNGTPNCSFCGEPPSAVYAVYAVCKSLNIKAKDIQPMVQHLVKHRRWCRITPQVLPSLTSPMFAGDLRLLRWWYMVAHYKELDKF